MARETADVVVIGAGVAGLACARRLAEPVAGTLYFTGEATDERLARTVAGGERAAGELLEHFQDPCGERRGVSPTWSAHARRADASTLARQKLNVL
jgi:flavin-dependent dehydrogenase